MRTRAGDEKDYIPQRANGMDAIKVIAVILGLLGGTITIGDRLWASKESVARVETKLEIVLETQKITAGQIALIHKAFMEASK